MRKNLYKENLPDSNISLTAYRALLILGLIISAPRTKEEIISVLKDNPLTTKSYSEDTLRVTLNTLKLSGCLISRPTIKNGFKYSLISHPFKYNITDKQAWLLNKIRKDFISSEDWETVLCINSLYNKIIHNCRNDEAKTIIKAAEPLSDIKPEILATLTNSKVESKELIIEYLSPKNGLEELTIIPNNVFFENSRLYIWCYLKKYESESYLRIDKIKSIKTVGITPNEVTNLSYKAFYEIKGESVSTYTPLENERIKEKNNSNLIIETIVLNEFKVLQRFLTFGNDLVDIFPSSLKLKLINKLQIIKKEYQNEQ